MLTVTMCGSMRFSARVRRIAWELETKRGYCVLQCVYGDSDDESTESIDEAGLKRLKAAHYRRIELSDAIFVVDIDGYIGDSTRQEISFAEAAGKKVMYYSGSGAFTVYRGENPNEGADRG